jgi:PhnB protein
MPGNVSSIPQGYQSVIPALSVRGAAAAIEFYQRAFGAEERYRMAAPDGSGIAHAETAIGDCVIMMADESPVWGNRSPQALGGSPVCFSTYVEDVDAAFARAVAAGATVVQEPQDQFYGDRSGSVADPFGYRWTLMTHVEDVPMEEIERRCAELYAKMVPAS